MMFPKLIVVCPEIMQNTVSTMHGKKVQFLGAPSLIVAKVPISFIVSACLLVSPPVRLSTCFSSVYTGRIFMKFYIGDFYYSLSIKLNLFKIGEKVWNFT
jgi:hypothetical protein